MDFEIDGVTRGLMSIEFIEKNELSEKSYEELDALGLPKDLVDGYIAGQKALADNDVSEVQKVVGGQDNYAQLLDWSSKNLTQSEKDAFNDTIDNGSTDNWQEQVDGLPVTIVRDDERHQQAKHYNQYFLDQVYHILYVMHL